MSLLFFVWHVEISLQSERFASSSTKASFRDVSQFGSHSRVPSNFPGRAGRATCFMVRLPICIFFGSEPFVATGKNTRKSSSNVKLAIS